MERAKSFYLQSAIYEGAIAEWCIVMKNFICNIYLGQYRVPPQNILSAAKNIEKCKFDEENQRLTLCAQFASTFMQLLTIRKHNSKISQRRQRRSLLCKLWAFTSFQQTKVTYREWAAQWNIYRCISNHCAKWQLSCPIFNQFFQ